MIIQEQSLKLSGLQQLSFRSPLNSTSGQVNSAPVYGSPPCVLFIWGCRLNKQFLCGQWRSIMFPGASSTGSSWYESKREVGSSLFSFHTEPGQNKCLRETYCFLLPYLISSLVSLNHLNLLMLSDGKQSSQIFVNLLLEPVSYSISTTSHIILTTVSTHRHSYL